MTFKWNFLGAFGNRGYTSLMGLKSGTVLVFLRVASKNSQLGEKFLEVGPQYIFGLLEADIKSWFVR